MTDKQPLEPDEETTPLVRNIVRHDRSGMTLEQLDALIIPWHDNTHSMWVGLGENGDQPEQPENDPTPT